MTDRTQQMTPKSPALLFQINRHRDRIGTSRIAAHGVISVRPTLTLAHRSRLPDRHGTRTKQRDPLTWLANAFACAIVQHWVLAEARDVIGVKSDTSRRAVAAHPSVNDRAANSFSNRGCDGRRPARRELSPRGIGEYEGRSASTPRACQRRCNRRN